MPILSGTLFNLSLAWFALHLMYRVFDPRGIATRHFHWDADLVHRLRRLVRNLAWVLLRNENSECGPTVAEG